MYRNLSFVYRNLAFVYRNLSFVYRNLSRAPKVLAAARPADEQAEPEAQPHPHHGLLRAGQR